MLALVQAVPEIEARSGKPAIIIGGLAVICRLGGGYRATSDLDTVNRRSVDEPAQLEVLVSSGAARSDAVGVIIPTPAGDVKVDVLEVSDSDLQPLPEDPNDRLHVLSHAWAAETASFVTIGATDGTRDGYQEVVTRVAEPGPLIAMKLQSVMNRPAAKEGTDLLDIVRLLLDRSTRTVAVEQLGEAGSVMMGDVRRHADLWFTRNRERTIRRIRAVNGGAEVDEATLDIVSALLPMG